MDSRNTSEAGCEGDGEGKGAPKANRVLEYVSNNHYAHANQQVNALVATATQMMGAVNVDGATLALAAVHASNSNDAFMCLAGATAKTGIENEKTSSNTARAVALAQLAIEDMASCDFDSQKKFKKLEEEAENLKHEADNLKQHVSSLTGRLERAEGMLGQLLDMMMRGQTEPSEVRAVPLVHLQLTLTCAQIVNMLQSLGL